MLKAPVPTARPDLPAFLKAYEPYGGLVIQWQMYGPGGHDHRPHGPTMVEYTRCIPIQDMHNLPDFMLRPIGHTKSFTATRWVLYTACLAQQCFGYSSGPCTVYVLRAVAVQMLGWQLWRAPLSTEAWLRVCDGRAQGEWTRTRTSQGGRAGDVG